MKVIWTSVLIVATGCGFQAATLRPSGSAAVAGKELRVEIYLPRSKRAMEVPLELVDDFPVVRCRLPMNFEDGPITGNPAVRAMVARGEPQLVAWAFERENGGIGKDDRSEKTSCPCPGSWPCSWP